MSEEKPTLTPPKGPGKGEPTPQPNPSNPPAPDLKEKLRASGQEALALKAERDKLKEQLGKLTTIEPPNEEELQTEFPEWDIMTDGEKAANKNVLTLRKQVAAMQVAIDNVVAKQQLQGDLQRAVAKFPKLKGHEAEFGIFIRKHPGIKDLKLLANAFLNELSEETPLPAEPPPSPSPNEEEVEIVLERGAGGPETPSPTSTATEMTAEEAADLRQKDSKRYNELARQKKLVIKEG